MLQVDDSVSAVEFVLINFDAVLQNIVTEDLVCAPFWVNRILVFESEQIHNVERLAVDYFEKVAQWNNPLKPPVDEADWFFDIDP